MTGHAVPVPETPEVPVVPPAQNRPPKVRARPTSSLLDPLILRRAVLEAFVKLDPRTMIGNPVMFVVEIGSVITTVEFFARPDVFVGLVTLWLWATVLFANFAEAVAEGRGKAQADTLRRGRRETVAQLLRPDGTTQEIPAAQLRAGNLTVVTAGQVIPGDGNVVEGMAVVDESAITGESAPVIRESGGDRSAVTGGTIVLSDRIVVQVTSNPGETFLDRMIALVEGASRFAILFMFGRLIGKPRQAYALVAVMAVIFVAHTVVSMQAERHGNHLLPASVSQAASNLSPGGNMEGEETRFGPGASALMTVGTMGTTAGATDSALDSYTPVGGTGAFAGILLGEISPGGDGGGLYTILVLSLLAVFVAGLMVGRTPEFLGKKIRAPQMKLIIAYVLALPTTILIFGGISLVIRAGTGSILNPGFHGLTEVTYAYASVAQNNGSAFAGLAANTPWYDTTLGLTMLIGRFAPIVLALAIAGSLAGARVHVRTRATLDTTGPTFVAFLLGVIVIVGGLIYFPMLILGPIGERIVG